MTDIRDRIARELAVRDGKTGWPLVFGWGRYVAQADAVIAFLGESR